MRTKILLPTVAMLFVVLFGGCQKDQVNDLSSAMTKEESSVALRHQSNQSGVNLGIAGNFVVLSKSGITNVYKSTITGDIGTSPITGAAIGVTCAEVAGTIYSVNAAGPLPCRVTNASRLTKP